MLDSDYSPEYKAPIPRVLFGASRGAPSRNRRDALFLRLRRRLCRRRLLNKRLVFVRCSPVRQLRELTTNRLSTHVKSKH